MESIYYLTQGRLEFGRIGPYLSERRKRIERDGGCEAVETDRWT